MKNFQVVGTARQINHQGLESALERLKNPRKRRGKKRKRRKKKRIGRGGEEK